MPSSPVLRVLGIQCNRVKDIKLFHFPIDIWCFVISSGDKFMHAGFMRIVGGTLNKDLMEDKTFAANGDKIKPHPGYNFRTRAFNLAFIKVGIL